MKTPPRIVLITLGFCPNVVFKHTAQRVKETLSNRHPIDLVFIAKPYPIDKELNLKLNKECAIAAGYRVIERSVDSGAAGDFNKCIFEDIGIDNDDIVINFDSDIYAVNHGWDDALIRVMQGDSQISWACLWNDASTAEFTAKSNGKAVIDGIRVEYAADWMMAGVSAFRGSFLTFTGGMVQPTKYYGGVEFAMWQKVVEHGSKQAFLADFHEDQRIKHTHEQEQYKQWKAVHTQTAFGFSFEEWLTINQPT
jgi:hypothetical protein